MFPTHGLDRLDGRTPDTEAPDIPGYAVLNLLGRGGMGVVYKALHLKLARTVAVKMLLAGEYAAAPERARFVREAQSIAVLRHPNIIQIFDVGDMAGRPYFSMEYLEGGSLSEKLAGVPQPGSEAAAMVATLAEAIQVAHTAGIVHRDLKPANILLTADGKPKICDFGLARNYTEAPELTPGGSRLGTPSYMSPEQALGRQGTIGPPADIYSLGAVLYELMTGRPPFIAETPAETELQVIAEEPAPPSRLNAEVPRDLETICLKCLSKDPERRYASASALTDDLRRYLRGEPIAARRAGPLERLGKCARRYPARTSAWLGGAVALGAILGSFLWMASHRAAIDRAVMDDLAEAVRLEHASDWRGAQNALERAKTRLAAGGARGSLEKRANEIERDLDLVDRFAEIRFERASSKGVDFDRDEWWSTYHRAFAEAGLLADGDSPEAFAARVRRSPVRTALVEAMDDMAVCASRTDLGWLFSATRLADPDPWRDKARDLATWTDLSALTVLARDAPVEDQPVDVLLHVAGELFESDPSAAEAMFRRIQAAHPSDYWANMALADTLDDRADADAINYYRVTIAIRPEAAETHFSLGTALGRAGRLSEAIESLERAVALDPASANAEVNLALCFLRDRRFEVALEHTRIATRLDPKQSKPHLIAGRALQALGNITGALESYQAAMDLEPEGGPLRASIERSYAECKEKEAAAGADAGMPASPSRDASK